MTVKPGDALVGKTIGYFTLNEILKVNGQPVFVITNLHEATFQLSLEEMREEKPKHWTGDDR